MAVAQIQIRRGTTVEWAAADPVVLAAGEPGLDTTTGVMKLGDGATAWASLLTSVFLMAHPIGSIYMSVDSTNPGTIYGGAWSAWGAGRVPVGIDAGQTEFDTVEETGGAKTHTLQTTEMPSHSHNIPTYTGDTTVGPNVSGIVGSTLAYADGSDTSATGDGGAHNNLQPYIVCYMWKRTA